MHKLAHAFSLSRFLTIKAHVYAFLFSLKNKKKIKKTSNSGILGAESVQQRHMHAIENSFFFFDNKHIY